MRKSKCGASPPDPCPNCVASELPCTWPSEDGRSSKQRLLHSKSSTLANMAAEGQQRRAMESQQYPNTSTVAGSSFSVSDTSPKQGWTDPFKEPWPGECVFLASLTLVVSHLPKQSSSTSPPFPGLLGDPDPQSFPLGNSMVAPGHAIFAPPPDSLAAAIDPAHFIWAVSSQLPSVEDATPVDDASSSGQVTVGPDPSLPPMGPSRPKKSPGKDPAAKIVKITWWRPHGQTAIAPGLKKITLKVRVDTPRDSWRIGTPHVAYTSPAELPEEIIGPEGLPSSTIMRHLLDVFMSHFGSQFPFLDRHRLEDELDTKTGSVFLFNCIAAIAARFSTHPAIALPDLQPHEYGAAFTNRAKDLLGSMLSVPSRETVTALVLLAHIGFANGEWCERFSLIGRFRV